MTDTSDLDRQIEQLKRCEIIKESEVKALCAKAREILMEESNVQRVDSPVIVSSHFSCFYNFSNKLQSYSVDCEIILEFLYDLIVFLISLSFVNDRFVEIYTVSFMT